MINTLLSLFLAFSLATADAWFYPDSSKPTETWRLGEAKELKWNTRYASYNIWLQQNRVTGPKGRFLVYSFSPKSGQIPITSMNWTVQRYEFDFSLPSLFYFDLTDGKTSMTSHYISITTDNPVPLTSTTTTTETVTTTATTIRTISETVSVTMSETTSEPISGTLTTAAKTTVPTTPTPETPSAVSTHRVVIGVALGLSLAGLLLSGVFFFLFRSKLRRPRVRRDRTWSLVQDSFNYDMPPRPGGCVTPVDPAFTRGRY